MRFPIITLATDFGLDDEYVGLMKGVILNINPKAKIIDISHSIPRHDIKWAAYLLFYSYSFFPKGTIHVVVVDPGVGTNRSIICVKADEHIFLCPDNGIITKVLDNNPGACIYLVENKKYFLSNISNTFHGRDVFAPVAAYVSLGKTCGGLGPEVDDVKRIELAKVRLEDTSVSGEVIHIDKFGNITTNIEKDMIDRLKAPGESIIVNISGVKIEGLKKSYDQVNKGGLLSIIGSRGLLEISANKDNASRILDVKCGAEVKISSR